jgi:hypothetical protein
VYRKDVILDFYFSWPRHKSDGPIEGGTGKIRYKEGAEESPGEDFVYVMRHLP